MFKYIFISLRIPHWTKNLFIFAAIIFAKQLFNVPLLLKTFFAFILFCLVSSAGYLINDIADIAKDKKHPIKSKRPIASGKLTKNSAIGTVTILAGISLTAGFWINKSFGIILAGYFIVALLYSFFIKHIVILDVFFIALEFILRVAGGGAMIQVEISYWLLICTGLLALFLGFSKRRHELILLEGSAPSHRYVLTEYSPYFLDQMISVTTAAALISYILYTISPVTVHKFGTDKLLLTAPFVLYGIFRYLYLIHKKKEGGNPTRLLLNDIPLMLCIILWALSAAVIIY